MSQTTDEQVSRAVRSLDPYPGELAKADDDQDRARTTLEQILASDRRGPILLKPRVGRRLLIAVPLVAAVTAGLILTQASPDAGPGTIVLSAPPQPLMYVASTEPLSARESLGELADRVSELQPGPVPTAPILGINVRSFDLYTVVGDNGAVSTLEENLTTHYVTGNGTVTSMRGGQVTGSGPTMWGDLTFSDNVADLRAQLQIGHPPENGVQSVLAAITDLYREVAPDPGVRAGVLRILAEQPGIRIDGTVTDRAGRTGIGYSIVHDGGGLPERVTLIFDPSTGQLLDQETVLISDAGALNVPIPSVVSYEVFLGAEYVHQMPAG